MSWSALPVHWRSISIGDLCSPIGSVAFQQGWPSTFRYVDISSIDNQTKTITGAREIAVAEAPSRARQVMRANDVLVSTVRPNLNAVALVPSELEGAICSTGFCVLRANQDVLEPEFLFSWVQHPTFVQGIVRLARGIGYPAVSDEDVTSRKIPLPPLPEQRRIVAILRQADELRQLRRQAHEQAQRLLPALFHEMFGNPATNQRGWPEKELADPCVGQLDRGRSRHRPRDAAHLFGGPFPFIQTGDVANSDGWITQYSQTYSEAGLAQSRLWPAGTLCITIAANIARTAILTFDACFPDSVVGFTPNSDVTVEYVRQWFVAIQNRLESAAPQAAQKNINLNILRHLRIPIPPKELQQDFSKDAASMREIVAVQQRSETRLNVLYSSVAAQAFTGQLTATWREQHAAELQEAAAARDAALARAPRHHEREAAVVTAVATLAAGVMLEGRGEVKPSKRVIYEELDLASRHLLDDVWGRTAYFRPDDLSGDGVSLVEAEEGLRLLAALGFVRQVEVRKQKLYRRVMQPAEDALPGGLDA